MTQRHRIARSASDQVTSNVLALQTHSLVVATDYAEEDLDDLEDVFELTGGEAADGYRQELRPSDDALEIDGVLVLEFVGLQEGGTYSLHVRHGESGTEAVFEDVPFEELSRLSPDVDREVAAETDEERRGRRGH